MAEEISVLKQGEKKMEELPTDNKKRNVDDNTVFVGNKPLVNYIKSVLIQFNKRNAPEVIIKSRGKFISKAVDVAEIIKRTLEKKGVQVKDIKIASEHFENRRKKNNNLNNGY